MPSVSIQSLLAWIGGFLAAGFTIAMTSELKFMVCYLFCGPCINGSTPSRALCRNGAQKARVRKPTHPPQTKVNFEGILSSFHGMGLAANDWPTRSAWRLTSVGTLLRMIRFSGQHNPPKSFTTSSNGPSRSLSGPSRAYQRAGIHDMRRKCRLVSSWSAGDRFRPLVSCRPFPAAGIKNLFKTLAELQSDQ